MTKKEVERYQDLNAKVDEQAMFILSVFYPLGDKESYLKLDFDDFASFGPKIRIWYTGCSDNGKYNEFVRYPESYLYMSKKELAAEKKRLDDEHEELIKKISSIAAKAAEKREKRNRDARYKRYLKLKEEFEGVKDSKDTDKPKEESVYECAHFEYEYDDLGKYRWCRNRKSGRAECNCDYIYAQQFCPFYEKGKLRGKWLIGEREIEAAKMFKEEFENKEDK